MEQALFESVISYGALGACTVYFAIKDWRLSERVRQTIETNTAALSELTTALRLLEARVDE